MEPQLEHSDSKIRSGLPRTFWILFLIGLAVCGFSFLFDQSVIAWVREHNVKNVTRIAGYLSSFGDWPELMAYGCVGLAVSFITGNKCLRRLFICMMIAATIAGALVNSVRITSGRARPNNTEATQEWNGLWDKGGFLLFKNKYHSFPSGHTGSAFAFFGFAAFARKGYGWLWLIPAALIGWSRIQINAHHLSDVLAGMIVGLTVAYLMAWRFLPRSQESGAGS
jgi:membrane-associated phospholipid phosphatase